MTQEKDTNAYGLEPADDAPDEQTASLPLEDAEAEIAPEPDAIKALDVCPNCGAPMGSVDIVVCLRCGFDFKKLKVIETETGETIVPEKPVDAPPLSAPGVGDLLLPAALAGVSLLLLAIGYLSGSLALLGGTESVGFGTRLMGLLAMVVRTGLFAVAGVAGLAMLAQFRNSKLGDLQLAATRMLGIVAVVGLVSFFRSDLVGLERTIELLGMAVAFVGLAMLLFRFNLRDAASLLGVAMVAALMLLLVSGLVQWALLALWATRPIPTATP